MAKADFPMVDVVRLKPLPGKKLWLLFSTGEEAVHDLTALIAGGGPMVTPLQNDAVFSRVFVEMGVPAWPNGFDLDAINLYMECEAAGELKRTARAQ
jgi:hypothetical protein